MEANSITPVKSDYRPAGTQAQSGLGDIFQDLLRESAWRLETPVAPSRYDVRSDRAEPRRDPIPEPARTDARPYSGLNDDNINDFNTIDTPAAAEWRRERDTADAKDRDATSGHVAEATPAQTTNSNRRSQEDDDSTAPTSTDAQSRVSESGSELSPPAAAGSAAGVGDTAASSTEGLFSVASVGGGSNPTAPVSSGLATGTAGSEAQYAAKATNPAAGSAAAQSPSAATADGSNGKPTTTTVAGNGSPVQVSIKAAPVVAQPTATLGAGAATAAVAAPTGQNLTGPALSGAETGHRAAQATSNTAAATQSQAQLVNGGSQGAVPNAQGLPAEGQAPAAQSGSAASVAGAALKLDSAAAAAQGRGADTPVGPSLEADQRVAPSLVGQTTAAHIRPALGNSSATSGEGAGTLAGQSTPGQGDASKTANALTQDTRTAQQSPSDLTPKALIQTPPAGTPSTSVVQGAQIVQSQASAQGGPKGDASSATGSAGQADAVSSRGAGSTLAATGGFTQPAVSLSGTLGSPSRSGAAHSVPADQVAVEIQRAVGAGKDHVRVRLHPAELGQIDVSLKVRHDGTIRAIVTADRPETFDLLQRDARGLERALHDAGLKTDSGSLSFNLRGGDSNGPNGGQTGANGTAQAIPDTERPADAPLADTDTPPPVVSSHALDIRV